MIKYDIDPEFITFLNDILGDNFMSNNNTVTAETLAKIFAVTDRRIQQLAKDKVIPKDGKGQYPLMPSIMAYIQYLQSLAKGKNITPEDIHVERLKKIRIENELLELEAQKQRGEVLDAEIVAEKLCQAVLQLRDNLLTVPPRIAPKLVNIDSEQKILEIIETCLLETMHVMSDYQPSDGDDA